MIDPDDYQPIAQAIRRRRRLAGLGVQRLSELTGIGPDRLMWLEGEATRPSQIEISRIAEHIGCTVGELLDEASPAPAEREPAAGDAAGRAALDLGEIFARLGGAKRRTLLHFANWLLACQDSDQISDFRDQMAGIRDRGSEVVDQRSDAGEQGSYFEPAPELSDLANWQYYRIERNDGEINAELSWADDGIESGSNAPGLSFEQGMEMMLKWLVGESDDPPSNGFREDAP